MRLRRDYELTCLHKHMYQSSGRMRMALCQRALGLQEQGTLVDQTLDLVAAAAVALLAASVGVADADAAAAVVAAPNVAGCWPCQFAKSPRLEAGPLLAQDLYASELTAVCCWPLGEEEEAVLASSQVCVTLCWQLPAVAIAASADAVELAGETGMVCLPSLLA